MKVFSKKLFQGGWGIVLLCCVVLVQLLVHGFVLSYGVLVARVTRRFRVSLVEAGAIQKFLVCGHGITRSWADILSCHLKNETSPQYH